MSTVRTVVHPGWLAVSAPEVDAVVAVGDRPAAALEVAAADGLGALLEALTDAGLSSAPDLAACTPIPTGLRVVLRGAPVVVLPDGTRLSARGRMPWLDVDLDLTQEEVGQVVLEAPAPERSRGWQRPARLSRAVEPEPEPEPEPDLDAEPTKRVSAPTLEVPVPASEPPAPRPDDDGRAVVLAVRCPAGHPSPPQAGTCRTCGREIAPQQPAPVPRPSLGVLRISTGGSVPLDRGVLLGRAPRVDEALPANQRPHVLRVGGPDRDISRNHAEVVLDDWHVLVRDLGSTNGTTVTLPGQEPVRLRPTEHQRIEPGTVVRLANEVELTYDVQE